MPVSFNTIASDVVVPGVQIEFDSSRAISGPQQKPLKALVCGQRLATGTVAAKTPKLVTSVEQARGYFGVGSMLHGMAAAYFKQPQRLFDCTFVALDDAGGGTAAALTLTITVTTALAGTIVLYVGDHRIAVGVQAGDAQNTIATNVRAAVNLENTQNGLSVTAAGSTNQVVLTCTHKGVVGNEIDVRLNYYDGETLPGGVTVSGAPATLAGGATNPTVDATLWVAIGETQFDFIAWPWTDSAALATLNAELDSRWGPVRENDSFVCAAKRDTHANLLTLGAGLNELELSIMGVRGMLAPPWETAAAYAAVHGYYARQDPARPLQTLPLSGLRAPAPADQFSYAERDLLYRSGISACTVDAGGVLRLDRTVTTYQKTPTGALDPAYRDSTTPATLSFLRWSFRTRIQLRYPRHKVASDGTKFGPGQAVLTPKTLAGEAYALYREWEAQGLVENFDAFVQNSIFERDASDPSRLNAQLAVDLVNGARVFAVQMQFRL